MIYFNLVGSFTDSVLIGSHNNLDQDSPDTVQLKEGDQYIIPGTSIKGIVRARMNKISNLLGMEKAFERVFAIDIKAQTRLMVSDAIIDFRKEPLEYFKIRIDRFTGGVKENALMNEAPVNGNTSFNLQYNKTKDTEIDNKAIKLIIYALRDLGTENISIGSGWSVGRGRLKTSRFVLVDDKLRLETDFTSYGIEEFNDYINKLSNIYKGGISND